jgi:hypothetical protein
MEMTSLPPYPYSTHEHSAGTDLIPLFPGIYYLLAKNIFKLVPVSKKNLMRK